LRHPTEARPVGRIVTRDELTSICRAVRAEGRTVVFTNGCFDIIHRGHTYYLEKARSLGDVLIVGVNTDRSVRELKGPCRPIVPEEDRAAVVAALASVDFVCMFDEPTPYELVRLVEPDVIVKGAGYDRDSIVGADLVEGRGGRVVALEALDGRSTRSIIRRILDMGADCLR
jgi:rfaE bifunctional protein nucleotidyltransferase chain/domain